jgi:hypothetical protein
MVIDPHRRKALLGQRPKALYPVSLLLINDG